MAQYDGLREAHVNGDAWRAGLASDSDRRLKPGGSLVASSTADGATGSSLVAMEASIAATLERAAAIRAVKNPDYVLTDDAFDNFRKAGELAGCGTKLAWLVYAYKHWTAVVNFCRAGTVGSEPIEGRIADLINYLLILQAIADEERARDVLPDGLG